MANYNVDIGVKVKAGQLTNFNKVLDKTQDRIDAVNKNIQRFASLSPKHIKPVTQSFSDLTMMVNKANAAFNKSTLGTPQAADAARNLLRANEQLNIGLEKRARLLQQVTLEMKNQKLAERGIKPGIMYSGPIGPGQATSAFTGRVQANVARSQEIREIVAAGSNRAKLGGGFKEFNKHAKKIQADTKKISTIVAQNQAQGIMTFGNQQYQQPIGPVRPGALGRLGIGTGANPRGMFANPRGRGGRISSGLQSGLIGGGFPLLFGQGGAGAIAGGLGGALGGALSPGFGFAGSIAATAIVSRIQETIDFRKAVDKLNVSIRATGGTSLFTAKQVTEFAKSLGMTKDEALEALKAFKQFEASARITLLKTFGSEGTFDIFAGLKDNASIISALPALSKELDINQAISALETLKSKDATAAQDQLLGNIISKNKEIIKQESKKVGFFEKLNPFRGEFRLNDPSKGILGGGGFMTVEELEEFKAKNAGAEFDSLIVQAKERLRLQRQFNEELERQAIIKAPVDELNRLLDPLTQIDQLGKSIGNSFSESFKGIVKGSMTAQEALRNLFMRTADAFLDMAAQILAAQIRSGIMGLFSSFLGPKTFTSPNPTPTLTPEQQVSRFTFGKADGGPVKGGNSYIVGERGPELFSPGVSGMITPNEMLGGSTNIVVNVDASGSSVEGDEQQGRELGRMISVAIQSELIKQKRPGGMLA